jgi:hypothetical protein
MPHLRRLHVRSATLPCVICDASMCDLHRVQLTTLDARCSGGRPLPRCRAVVAGGRGRWQCTRGRGARTRASSTGVVGQAAGKLPYATTLWLLDAVARHATAASSDFLRSRSGGAPTGASTSADNATKTDIKTEAATTAAPSLFWSPWPRRLLIGFRPTAARLGSSVRCVCAAGCYAPLTASREGPPWAFGTGTSTAPSPRTCLDRGGTRIRVLISNVCRLYYDPHSLIYRKATRLVSPWHAQAHVVAFRRPVPPPDAPRSRRRRGERRRR